MSVKIRRDKWVADVMVGGRTGKRIHHTFPTRALAIAFEGEVKVREVRGELIHGTLTTYSPSGKELVLLGATADDDGVLNIYSPSGKRLVGLIRGIFNELRVALSKLLYECLGNISTTCF